MLININKTKSYCTLWLIMKESTRYSECNPLADMHTDGVRFDPGVRSASWNQGGSSENESSETKKSKI